MTGSSVPSLVVLWGLVPSAKLAQPHLERLMISRGDTRGGHHGAARVQSCIGGSAQRFLVVESNLTKSQLLRGRNNRKMPLGG